MALAPEKSGGDAPKNDGSSSVSLLKSTFWGIPSGKHTTSYGKWQFSSLIFPLIAWRCSSSRTVSLPEGMISCFIVGHTPIDIVIYIVYNFHHIPIYI